MRGSVTSANVPAGTVTPPHEALLFPSLLTVRVTIRDEPSTSAPISSSCSFESEVTENCAVATRRSDPCLTSELSLLPPRTRLKAVRIIVFPAPVSPVNTFKPRPSSSSDCSMIPRLRIEISSRYERSLTAPTFNGKFELCNQSICEERL